MSAPSAGHHRAPALRCLGVWLGVGLAVLALGALVLPELVAAHGALVDGSWRTRSLDVLLGWLAATAAALALGWLWIVSGVVVLDAARGARRERLPGCPLVLRRLLLAACGAAVSGSLVAGMTLPASADPLPRPVPVGGGSLASGGATGSSAVVGATDGPDLHGLPMPDRARSGPRDGHDASGAPRADDGRGPRARTTPRDPVQPAADLHVVRTGDTLWDVAADQLASRHGGEVTATEIDARWRALWAANADVVGPDPDLILPGQRLRPPGDTRTDRTTDRSHDQEAP